MKQPNQPNSGTDTVTHTPHETESSWNVPRCTLGESLLWDGRAQCYWWVDVPDGELYRLSAGQTVAQRWQFEEALGHVALTENPERIVLGLKHGLERFDSQTGERVLLARVPHATPELRINDGRCDRHGHLVFGTMAERQPGPRGAFWWFGADEGLKMLDLPAPAIPNSICFSPDGTRLYFTDSLDKIIKVCDYDPFKGSVSRVREFANHGPVAWEPDGSCVDAEGGVWNARWAAGCIVRYRPDGMLDRVIETRAVRPTCPCLSGPRLDLLCASSASIGIDAACITDADGVPFSVGLAGVQGLPEGRVAGV